MRRIEQHQANWELGKMELELMYSMNAVLLVYDTYQC